MKIILNGAAGHMGRIMADVIRENGETLAAGVDKSFAQDCPEGCFACLDDCCAEADCIIDFSHHSAVRDLVCYAVRRKLPLVVATTGHTEEELQQIREAAEERPDCRASNFSLGVALTAELVRKTAKAFPNAEIEIIERHHDRKLDVPSGTALTLAESIREVRPEMTLNVGRHENGKRTPEEIGIHSLRYGNEVGTHEIIFSTGRETITIRHEAENRALFADGALAAARYLVRQPEGLYGMNDLMR